MTYMEDLNGKWVSKHKWYLIHYLKRKYKKNGILITLEWFMGKKTYPKISFNEKKKILSAIF